MNKQNEAKRLLDPILDVFGGTDGGAAFSKLRDEFLPDALSKAGDSNTTDQFLKMVSQFSRLCELMLK
jgi:hypothetical protein